LFDEADTAKLAKERLGCDAALKDVQLFLVEPIIEPDPKRIDV
jgi:hypothetical protein